ncbi:putative reverse transcriptase domain-containing protein [Tanacetum coccineum]
MILTTNTPYPSRKIRRIRACTHQRPQRKEDQYAVSREDQYAVLDIWHVNILEDIKRGPYSKKLQYAIVTNLMKEDVGNVPVWVKLHDIPVTAFSEDGLSVIATKLGTPLMLDSYTYGMCIQSWGRSSYARALIEVQDDVELKDNIVVVMPKLVRDGFYTRIDECPKIIDSDVVKNMKKPSQATRSVLTSNLASKKTNSSGSLFWNVESSSISTTPLVEKIDKIERLFIDGKVTLVDDKGKHLIKVDSSSDHDSEDEVASVDDDMTNFLASKKVGYGTNSLLEQWKESYVNGDYGFDPYDDDMR